MRPLLASFVIAGFLTGLARGQWNQVCLLGKGGESTVATDNTGNVYVTCHLPAKLFGSRDWGASFTECKAFPDALGDMFVLAKPTGPVVVTYLGPKIDGIQVWHSNDFGKTGKAGKGLLGPLDREWMVAHPTTGRIYMDYTDGYIGGPKSKGAFLAASDDDGASFQAIGRIDKEPEGRYAVDPYLSLSSAGRLYAVWLVSSDYNTVDACHFAYSDDGKTFVGHQSIADFPSTLDGAKVDNQERWMQGSVLGFGEKNLIILYPAHRSITVDGKRQSAMLMEYRASEDGGRTFGPGRSVLADSEVKDAIREFLQNKRGSEASTYIQTLPWMCSDAKGQVHLAFTDNRHGQNLILNRVASRWQVRFANLRSLKGGFGQSEAVSQEYVSVRPPMDFLSCAADSRYAYVSWTANNGSTDDWPNAPQSLFTGSLAIARKAL